MGRLRYRQLEHTSDLKVEVFGEDLPDLFRNGAECVTVSMLGRIPAAATRSEPVRLNAPDPAELFLDWLRELIYLFSVKRMAISRADVTRLAGNGEWRLEAEVSGDDFDPERHGLVAEIKAPTYHEFACEIRPGACRAVVVFDV